MDTGQSLLSLAVLGVLFIISQEAAVGAIAGSSFFLLHQTHHSFMKRMAYAVLSTFVGYSVGIGVGGSYTMFAALIGSAVAVVSLDKVVTGISSDNPVPPILQWIVALFRK